MEIKIERITDPKDPRVEKVYEDIIVKLFYHPDYRERLEDFQLYLEKNKEWGKEGIEYVYLVASKEDKILGCTIFGLFCNKKCSFIKGEFTAVVEEGKQLGVFNKIMQAKLQFGEELAKKHGCKNLDLNVSSITESFTKKSQDLIKFWKALGFQRVNFPFIQLPVSTEHNVIYDEVIYIQPLTEEYKQKQTLDEEEMKIFIDACNFFRNSDVPLEEFKEYQKMMEDLKKEKHRQVEQ